MNTVFLSWFDPSPPISPLTCKRYMQQMLAPLHAAKWRGVDPFLSAMFISDDPMDLANSLHSSIGSWWLLSVSLATEVRLNIIVRPLSYHQKKSHMAGHVYGTWMTIQLSHERLSLSPSLKKAVTWNNQTNTGEHMPSKTNIHTLKIRHTFLIWSLIAQEQKTFYLQFQ